MGPLVTDGSSDTDRSVTGHLPTTALPGQVRTVDGPSRPLSALGVRARGLLSVDQSTLAQPDRPAHPDGASSRSRRPATVIGGARSPAPAVLITVPNTGDPRAG